MFEYDITYYEVAYFTGDKEVFLAEEPLPVDPNPEFFYDNPVFRNEINRMGEAGWEMVTVQPLLRACYKEAAGIAFPLTAGYYIFWKRQK